MNDEATDKDVLRKLIMELRKYISYIVLSYKNIYGTTDLLVDDSDT
jgi:hypothetical protein